MPTRSRSRYALAIVVVIALGLASRQWRFLGQYPGDVLWALMVFLALGVLCPKAKGSSLALGTLLFSYAIEFLKLNQAAWLVSARQSFLGHLVFGHVFSWQNLVAYAGGALAGWWLDRRVNRNPAEPPHR